MKAEHISHLPVGLDAARICVASSFVRRLRGLMGTKQYPQQYDVLYFPRCRAIHTIGMRYPIDVVFLDSKGAVCAYHTCVKPGRWLIGARSVRGVLELAPSSSLKEILKD